MPSNESIEEPEADLSTFERSSLLTVDRQRLWDHVDSWAGINAELAPIAMSHPSRFPALTALPADGVVHMVSTLSLLGLPFDRHHLALVACVPGESFDERSSNRLLRRWTHRRELISRGGATLLTDRCGFEPRWRWMGPLLKVAYTAVFARRHARLRALFGSADPD